MTQHCYEKGYEPSGVVDLGEENPRNNRQQTIPSAQIQNESRNRIGKTRLDSPDVVSWREGYS